MPIKVTCQCGKSFAAKDELAGKAVKCPNCQQPLRIPGGAPSKAAQVRATAAAAKAPKPAAKPAAKPAPKPASSSSTSGIGLGEDLRPRELSDSALSEVGLHQQSLSARPCPGCTAPLAPDAVICIKCGYNTKLGRRMETMKVGSGGGGHEGHGAVVADLMDRAAESIEDQKAEDQRKTGEGMPWWVYVLALTGVVGFMVMMMVLPHHIALMTGGVILYVAAACISFYASIRILIIAFTESFAQGLLQFVPFYNLYYVFTRWDQCGTYFLMIVAANVVSNLVMFALQMVLSAMGDGQQQSVVPIDPHAAIVRFTEDRSDARAAARQFNPKVVTRETDLQRFSSEFDFACCSGTIRRRAVEAGAEDRGRSTGWHTAT